ncbi:MAG: heme NO-binding domain-containing protein [Cyanobacteria bacterium P01_D01_bin.156]
MYGLINKAIEDMVCSHFDEDTWEAIKEKAELDDIDYFMSMESYPDDVTHRLVKAACEVLDMSSQDILKTFGKFWVTYTASEGYGDMLDNAGENLPEFLRNLDNLHARVGLSFPQLQPPEFECEEENQEKMELHYHSTREGLGPMVVGLVEGLGERFNTPVTVERIQQREDGADHDSFSIEYKE